LTRRAEELVGEAEDREKGRRVYAVLSSCISVKFKMETILIYIKV